MAESTDPQDKVRSQRTLEHMGPFHVDQMIRHAIQMCWMALPAAKKRVDDVEKEIRRILDRALRDLREDAESFGME